MIAEEDSMAFGGGIFLDEEEQRANVVLMKHKSAELLRGVRNPDRFLPARDFVQARKEIEFSSVYRLIRAMPKAGLLHAHLSAIGSREFILGNVTRRSNLYICESNSNVGGLRLRFLDGPETIVSVIRHRRAQVDDEENEDGDEEDEDDDDDNENGVCGQPGGWRLLEEARKLDRNLDARIARNLDMASDDVDGDDSGDGDRAWNRFRDIFRFVKPLITYRPVYEDYLYHVLQQLYDDNVQLAEIRTAFSTLYELNGHVHKHLRVMQIYKKVADKFVRDHQDFVGVKWIYSRQRNVTDSKFMLHVRMFRQMRRAFPSSVVGFDLVGQEDRSRPLRDFAEILHVLGNETHFFFHAGETNWSGQHTDENLLDAVLLNAKRIGHGYALLKHPRLMELVKERGIAIEMSPISNQVLRLVRDLRNHPASYFFAQDLPLVVCNDDPGFWGAIGLSHDFYEAFLGIMSSRADLRALKQLALNSIRYSSLDEIERERLTEIWTRRWRELEMPSHDATESLRLMVVAALLLFISAQWGPMNLGPRGARASAMLGSEYKDYWQRRAELLNEEQDRSIGARMNLSTAEERAANQFLMQAKHVELEQGQRDASKFLPKQNFLTVGQRLAKSRVFRMIEAMPKGAVLHAHDTGIVSWEWVYWNVTYRPKLYACVPPDFGKTNWPEGIDDDEQLMLRFFKDEPKHIERNVEDPGCDWRLLHELRANDTRRPRAIDRAILRRLTMITAKPEQAYPTSDAAWHKFQDIFGFITPMLTYRPVYEDHFYRGLTEFYNDNVLYLELRTTLPTLYELDGTQYGPLDVARIYKKVSDRFVRDHPDFIGVKLIYAPMRQCSSRELDEFVSHARELKQALPDFIAGFDLVGQEDKGQPLMEFAERLRNLGRDVQLFFHAGETNWYGTSVDDNLIDAVLLNAKRIGHG
ncbi:hypothetical protein QAD02_024101, partial [Eretmocerus hayati]